MTYVGFDRLKGQLAQRPGVTNPAGIAATVGRRKYGAKAMQHAAATGHSLKGHKRDKRGQMIDQFLSGHGR